MFDLQTNKLKPGAEKESKKERGNGWKKVDNKTIIIIIMRFDVQMDLAIVNDTLVHCSAYCCILNFRSFEHSFENSFDINAFISFYLSIGWCVLCGSLQRNAIL